MQVMVVNRPINTGFDAHCCHMGTGYKASCARQG